jgi:hypothetical protein
LVSQKKNEALAGQMKSWQRWLKKQLTNLC